MTSTGFFTEIRRRRVLPIAGAYIAIAWLITEIASFLLEQASAPGWSLRLLAIVFMVGFPVTMVLAWVIQIGPDGKRVIDPSSGQGRTVFGAVALGILATAGLAWLILPRIEDAPPLSDYQPLPNSVAILPFVDADATPNERTVGETLYHALRKGLNQSRDLTQVQLKLKAPPSDLAGLGKRVRVLTLLTGRIESVPGGSRITMELLDVARNVVRWSHTFEWDPTKIMETGTDIANGVLESMALPVLSTDRFAGTDDRDAYDALLLGFRHQAAFNIAELRVAMEDFQRAIDLDPAYVHAYNGLVQTIFVYLNMKSPTKAEWETLTERQREAVDTSFALDESNPETMSLMGMLTENRELRIQLYKSTLELDPNDGHTYFRLGLEMFDGGDYEEAERLIRRALEFRPMSANYHSDLGSSLWRQGRHQEGIAEIERSIALNPRQVQNYVKLGAWESFHFGRLDEALINMRMAYALDPEAGNVASFVATSYNKLLMPEVALAWVNRALDLSPTATWAWTLAAFIHADLGNSDTARDYFLHLLELDAANRFALRELATRDIAQDQWEIALERWRQAYPELVSADEPLVDRKNLDVAVFFASNLLEAGQENEGLQLLNKCLAVALDMPLKSDSEYWASWIYVLMGDREEALAGIRRSIIDGHKGVEGSFLLRPEYDFLRDEPEFQELMQIIKTDSNEQRERILEMERNGEMPPAPGVLYEIPAN